MCVYQIEKNEYLEHLRKYSDINESIERAKSIADKNKERNAKPIIKLIK